MRLLLILLFILNLLHANKIALLIGNSQYDFQPLKNPLHDVDGLYRTLREIGFDISTKDVLKNASQNQMQQALARFSQRASKAEIALVYFSGHGMQVNNTNYLFPAHTTAKKPVDLFGLVNLDYLIQSATSARYGIVLVDACRNNPLVKYFQNGKHKGASAKKGLGQVTPKSGQVVIGFATSAGDTADDGDGDMSPYAEALAHRLKIPNKDITKILGLVALDVQKKHDQNPILRTNLAYDVYLNVKDKTEKPTVTSEEQKAEYDKVIASNQSVDHLIELTVRFLKVNHFEKYKAVKSLVNNVLDQYGKTQEPNEKSKEAVKSGDYKKALLYENRVHQYLIKSLDFSRKARKLLIKKIGTNMNESVKRGEATFTESGCIKCHMIGEVLTGPDLYGVLVRHENGEKWVADFIKNPKSKFKDPYVKGMLDYFNLRMPNLGISDKQTKDIIEYFKWIDKNSNLFE